MSDTLYPPGVQSQVVDSRKKYFHIAQQAATCGTLDFLGGGSFLYPDGYTGTSATTYPELAKGEPNVVNIWTQFQNNGYTVVHTLADLKAVPAGAKCVAASGDTQDSSAMHYQIDKPQTEWDLAEATAEAIRVLDNPNGFFMMVEGGKNRLDLPRQRCRTHLSNARAGLGWTTYEHTAVPVAVMSNDSHFGGYYDNTDMAKKLAAAMGVSLD